MPFLLVPLIIEGGALAGVAIGAETATLVANIAFLGATLGLESLLNTQKKPKVSSEQYQIQQSMPSLLYGYGRMMLGGSAFVLEAPGGHYLKGIVHCVGEIDSFQEWWLNDQNSGIAPVTITGPGTEGGLNAVLPWGGNIEIESHVGTDDQPASAVLLNHIGGEWTGQHQLKGLAYSVLRCGPVAEKNFQKVYSNGIPSLRVLAHLKKLYDMRDTTTSWKPNPALAIWDYYCGFRGTDSVTGMNIPIGYGISTSRMDVNSFNAFAYLCETPQAQKDGSTLAKYEVNGVFSLGEDDRRDVFARLCATCDAETYLTGEGKIAIRGGQWTDATVTITDDHIIAYELECSTGKLAAFNRLKVTFVDPANDYQQVEADPWDDLDNQAITGQVITQDFSVTMVQSFTQARRLAKIAMAKGNPKYKVTLTTDLYGLLVFGERIITVQIPEISLNTTFIVTGFTQNADGATCKIEASSLDSSAYDWDPAEEDGNAPAVAGLTTPVVILPDITGFTLGSDPVTMAIIATIDAPTDTTYELHGRFRKQGETDSDWRDMSDYGTWQVTTGAVSSGITYEVEVALWAPYGGTEGPWTSIHTFHVS